MSENESLLVNSFLLKLAQFIDQTNIIKDVSPTKRRDIREVISTINQVFKDNFEEQDEETKAIHYVDIALSDINALAESKINRDYAIQVILSFARVYYLLGEFDKAVEIYEEIIELSQKVNNIRYQAYANLKIGKIYKEKHQLELAKEFVETARRLYRSIKDYQGEMKCWYELGVVDHISGKYLDAQNYYLNSLQIADRISEIREIAYIKNNLGVINRIIGKKVESEKLLRWANNTFQELNDHTGQMESLNNLAIVFLQKSNYQRALTCLNESLEICKKVGDNQLMAFIYLNKSLFYLEVGDSRNATKFCTEALKIMRDLENPIGLAKVSRIYGAIFRSYQQYKIAAQFYEESINLYQSFEIPLGFASCCSEYAEMLVEEDNIEQAIKHYRMALDVFEELELFHFVEELKQTISSPQLSSQLEPVFMAAPA